MKGRRIRVRLTSCIALILLLAGCVNFKDDRITYEESKAQLVKLVDTALSRALNAAPVPSTFPPSSRACEDGIGRIIEDERYPTYGYEFPIAVLGANKESFVSTVGQYWQSQGMLLDPDDTPGVERLFAGGREFQFEVFVSEITGMAVIGGSGACGTPPFD